MVRVPALAGGRRPCLRLSSRSKRSRYGRSTFCSSSSSRPDGSTRGSDRSPRLGVSRSASQEPRRRRKAGRGPVPRPRPGRNSRLLRCGVRGLGDSGHPYADPGTQGQHLRRALRAPRSDGVSRPRPRLRTPAPGAGAPVVCRALYKGETAPRSRDRDAIRRQSEPPGTRRTVDRRGVLAGLNPRVSVGGVNSIGVSEPFRLAEGSAGWADGQRMTLDQAVAYALGES